MQQSPAIDVRAIAAAELERRRRARRKRAESISLAEFFREAWPVLEPATPLVWGWHIDAMCEHLEAVADGRIKRLIINIPPGMAKSLLVSVAFPAWLWLKRPHLRYLATTCLSTLTVRDAGRCRDLVESDWYRREFAPEWALRRDRKAVASFTNSTFGERRSVSVGGATTGFRGDLVIIDDPLDRRQATSPTMREAAADYVTKTLTTRVNNPQTSAMVLIMQRLHEDDPTGVLLKLGGWDLLCLPSEFDPSNRCTTSIGWTDPRTEPGELLFPQRYDVETLEGIKRALGSRDYAGQHQQRPAPDDGIIFKREWFQYFDAPPARFDEILTSWDATFGSKSATASYVCCGVWGRVGQHAYRLDEWRVRAGFVETEQAIIAIAAKWPGALIHIIEKKANGAGLMDRLVGHYRMSGIVEGDPKGESKEQRALSISPMFESGSVFLPRNAPWAADYVEELVKFPNGSNNDRVDETSQALARWRGSALSGNWYEGFV